MPLSQVPLLLLFLFPLAYSPGPGNMFFAALGARYGVAASLPATLGYHVATLCVSFAIGAGFMITFDPDSQGFALIQRLGAFYILWLAFRLYRSQSGPELTKAQPAGAIDGAVLLVLNPKGYLIMALMFSQFPVAGLTGVAVVAAVFTVNNMVCFLIWTALGQTLARQFRSTKAAHLLNSGFATCLGLVGVWLLIG